MGPVPFRGCPSLERIGRRYEYDAPRVVTAENVPVTVHVAATTSDTAEAYYAYGIIPKAMTSADLLAHH